MLINDRIKLIMKANNESPSSFADNIGIKRSNLSHVLSGRNKPSLDFLAKIISSYPNVNASWLITGVTREEGTLKEEKEEQDVSVVAKIKQIDKIVIFFVDGTFESYHPNEQ